MSINRDQIINQVRDEFQNNPFVFAFWLEGADAHDRVDQYSDIDMWLDVADDKIDEVLATLEQGLGKLAQLDFSYELPNHPNSYIRQKFFHLEGTPLYWTIDLCVQKHSRDFFFTKGKADEKIKLIFDKSEVIKYKDLDKQELKNELKQRLEWLEKTFIYFQVWIDKQANRANFLETFLYYQHWLLEPLVELIRIKYQPTKSDFYLKHISLDIPREIIEQLEGLFKVASVEDIMKQKQKANELFFNVLKTIEKENII